MKKVTEFLKKIIIVFSINDEEIMSTPSNEDKDDDNSRGDNMLTLSEKEQRTNNFSKARKVNHSTISTQNTNHLRGISFEA